MPFSSTPLPVQTMSLPTTKASAAPPAAAYFAPVVKVRRCFDCWAITGPSALPNFPPNSLAIGLIFAASSRLRCEKSGLTAT